MFFIDHNSRKTTWVSTWLRKSALFVSTSVQWPRVCGEVKHVNLVSVEFICIKLWRSAIIRNVSFVVGRLPVVSWPLRSQLGVVAYLCVSASVAFQSISLLCFFFFFFRASIPYLVKILTVGFDTITLDWKCYKPFSLSSIALPRYGMVPGQRQWSVLSSIQRDPRIHHHPSLSSSPSMSPEIGRSARLAHADLGPLPVRRTNPRKS